MLRNLYVKNLALIEECDIHLGTGLNVLSGETGAGKSILIGSINLALGAKASKDLIRNGKDFGLVELLFERLDDRIEEFMMAQDLPIEENKTVLIQRKITATHSSCKVNGQTVTAKQIKDLAEYLIDIHGQHEHQSLLKKAKHMEILDSFAGQEVAKLLKLIKRSYQSYQDKKQELEQATKDEQERKREFDFLNFEVNEIETFNLVVGEDEELESKFEKLRFSKNINQGLLKIEKILDFDEGIGSMLSQALRESKQILGYDNGLKVVDDMLMDIENILSETNQEISKYLDHLDTDEESFFYTEKRLNEINRLKVKYGSSIEEILGYVQEKKSHLAKLENYELYIETLQKELATEYQVLVQHCEKLSLHREAEAKKLEKLLQESLIELNFLDVAFHIRLSKKESPSITGLEEVEFLISTNPGEPVKPMGQVASGGELSRIMLAVKAILAKRDHIDTLIFDEIDVGISGKTAWKVSEKLGVLGQVHQIISITHLPQIAAMADHHYFIEKRSDQGHTTTYIEKMDENESTEELARMLGADGISESAMKHASEMKSQAKSLKKNNK